MRLEEAAAVTIRRRIEPAGCDWAALRDHGLESLLLYQKGIPGCRYTVFTCLGDQGAITPNLDRLLGLPIIIACGNHSIEISECCITQQKTGVLLQVSIRIIPR